MNVPADEAAQVELELGRGDKLDDDDVRDLGGLLAEDKRL